MPNELAGFTEAQLAEELNGRVVNPADLRTFPAVTPLSLVPEKWRQTFLAKYTECPRAAYLYVKYNGGALTHPLAGGTLLHRAIERFIRHMWDEEESIGNPETAKDILNEVLIESTDLAVSPERFDSCRGMMYHMAEGLAIVPDNIVCLETPVSLQVGNRTITGTIDFAEFDSYTSTLTVIDWKSAFYNAAKADIDDPEEEEYILTKDEWPGSFQLILYALSLATGSINGLEPLSGVENFRLRQIHPRHFWENEGTMAYREAEINRETLLDWQLYLESVVAELEVAFKTWTFPAIIGKHCDYCPASAECPIPPAIRNYRGEVRTEADARRAAILYESLGRQRKEVWEALKGWAKHTGSPLRFGRDRLFRWKKTESEKVKDKVAVPGSSKKIKGKDAMKEAVHKAVELGIPFQWSDFYTTTVSTRYLPRTLTDIELAQEAASQKKGSP